jgi:mannose-6-phosphate isomerase-like protein (cupin superfamily)
MKRRSILTGAAAISASALGSPIQADSPQRVIRVAAGQDRFSEHLPLGGGRSIVYWKVSAKDNGGAWSVFEAQWQAKGGPPLHVHQSQDEWFYVIQGEFVVQVGDERFRATPGDSLLAPRQVPHTFAHIGDGAGKMITAFQPAGSMEAFFREQSKITGAPSAEEVQRMFRAHGMEVLGPPLAL